MQTFFSLAIMFFAKILDNGFSTTKTILIQRGRCILAGLALAASTFISYCITKAVVNADGILAIFAVSLASGIGCCLAMLLSEKLSKDRTYVHVIMSDDKEAMQKLRDFLALHHITNVAADSYTRNWEKTITITAYPETKAENRLISEYCSSSKTKFKRLVNSK